MNIVRYLIQRPVAITMVVIAVIVMGLLAAARLPVSLLPDVDIPQVTVQVSRPGASAKQIEEQIVGRLRSRLSQISGLSNMKTVTSMDAATITLMFDPGSNIDMIFIDVNEKVDMAMGALPKDIERPKVMKSSVTDIPAFFIELTMKDPSAGMGRFSELSDFAQGVVRKRIEQLPQTAMVDISGTVGRKILITPNYDAMNSLGLTTADIEKALQANDIYLEALSVKDGMYRYNIHFDSQLLTVSDIANIKLQHEGRIVALADICSVEQHTDVRRGWNRLNGKNAVSMAVIKQSDARMDDLQEDINATLRDLREKYPEVEFSLTRDQTRLLAYSISNLESNLVVGAVLACLVLLVFLRNWRMALLVSLTIPLSLVVTLLFFHLFGITLNVISLSGLILGVGMIVDNAIIVTDNIMQQWTGGRQLGDVVPRATSEVFAPMLSSVLTTCSVFLPLIFLSGLAGQLFFDQAMGITISLFVSLAVAVLVVPVYFFMMYRRRERPVEVKANRFDKAITRIYERGMTGVLRRRKVFMALAVLSVPCLVAVFFLADKQRMPEIRYDDAQVMVNWNEGITEAESDKRMGRLMAAAGGSVELVSSMAGTQQFILSHTPAITASEAIGYIKCSTPAQLDKAKKLIRGFAGSAYPRATVTFRPSGNPFHMVLGSDEPTLEIRLRNAEGGRPEVACAEWFTDTLRKAFPDVYVPNVAVDKNIVCRADLWQMALYGISYPALLKRMKELAGANEVMAISEGSKEVPVVIGSATADRTRIMSAGVVGSEGVEVPVSMVLADSVVSDYKKLYASAEGEFYPVFVECGTQQAQAMMRYTDRFAADHRELTADFAGSYFTSRSLVAELLVVLAVALLLLFFIMAAQFESLVQPLIILSEIALDCFIVLLVLWLSGMSLNLMSMIGLVVMSGIVINDSILKVDTINRLRRGGMSLLRAIVTAGHARLRPILMTSATTILAVLPFLSRGDIGSDLQFPISITTIVGMSVGTAVSLFFVPVVYYIIYRNKK